MTFSESNSIPIVVAGALGKMGSEVVKAVVSSNGFTLAGAIETSPGNEGIDIGEALGIGALEVFLTSDFEGSICALSQSVSKEGQGHGAVLVDFTHPSVVYEHTRTSIAYGVHPVIGTTGLTPDQISQLSEFSQKASIGSAVIPNFSVGMVLLQQAASAAAAFYDHVELTESHHNQKADAPSGTCIKTAELIEELGKSFNQSDVKEEEFLKGSRGGLRPSGLRIHSLRLPGLVAHQEVLFGAPGETYLLKHDTVERSAYMPGVLLVIRKVRKLQKLVYGLEKFL
tara:strand:- start:65 stop:916 length:852 start_codon:yes stop_codon:yes gene_type:complete